MPGERGSECVRRVLDVNDAAVRGPRGWTRGVEQEGTKSEERSLGCQTNRLRKSCAELVNRVGGEAAEAMRSVEDSDRSIVRIAWIEMEANREHVFKHLDRWLHMRDTCLLGPRPIAG